MAIDYILCKIYVKKELKPFCKMSIFKKPSNKLTGHVQKHRQDFEHAKNAQFDIYAITSNFLNKFQ